MYNRLERFRRKLEGTADAAIITHEKNISYLCGFDYTDGCLVISADRAILFCDFRYIEAAKKEAKSDFEVVMFEGRRSVWLPDALAQMKVSTLAFEDMHMTVDEHARLCEDIPETELVKLGNVIENLREYKDEGEIQKMVAAQRIAEKAFEHILEFINPERTEQEVALELEFTMRRLGASAASFDTIAVSGSASSMPHGVPRPVKLEKGFFTMDFGCVYEGYCSDMTRTVCIGRADDEMKKVYDTVLTAQQKALAAVEFGISCSELDSVARDHIYNAGYEGCFGHGLGHGVGLDIHEAPTVSFRGGDKKLAPGHVITCEPGIYLEGKYGVRIEDMVVFHADRIENITNCPKHLIEIL